MDEIEKLRKKVDEIDVQIIIALCERAKACEAIGFVKKKKGVPVRDISEKMKFTSGSNRRAIEFHLDPVQVEAVYREIVNMCSAVQE